MRKLPKPVEKQNKKRGIALISVLAILTLAAVMILAFFSLSRNELTSSSAYSHGIEAQQLAQSAVNMVIHQIRSASDAKGVAWASQPGMIRTWNDTDIAAVYKLYSDETMVVTGGTGYQQDLLELGSWQSQPARYVDLNQPVIRKDPANPREPVLYYPIVDPRAKTTDLQSSVEGFDYSTVGVGTGPSGYALPMPVLWLYQLADGTLGYLSASNSFVAMNGNGTPSRANPMVGRIAFWADDETSKLNVNTAAGGRSWDTPRAGGLTDRNYGSYQPLQREYQRYPGHPATTSLAPALFPGQVEFGQLGFDAEAFERVYELTPRVAPGGSFGGNVEYQDDPPPIPTDRDRLYATIDEFIFGAPKLKFNEFGQIVEKDTSLPRTGRVNQLREQFKDTRWKRTEADNGGDPYVEFLDKLRFFLTANSRAPETTVFNTPRIAVWPTYHGNPETPQDEDYFSAFDRRIRTCAEMGPNPATSNTSPQGRAQYYFQREQSGSRTYDYNQIQRNQDLYRYMQWLTDQPIPGVGVTLASKYPENRDQILTEIFDYIRALNLFDDSLLQENRIPTGTAWNDNPADHKTFTNMRAARVGGGNERFQHPGHGQVAPIEIDAPGGGPTKGFGRMHQLMEAGIGFICTGRGNQNLGGEKKRRIENDGQQWVYLPGNSPAEVDYSNICPLSPNTPANAATVYAQFVPPAFPGGPVAWFSSSDPAYKEPGGLTGAEAWQLISDPERWNRTLPENTILENDEIGVQAILMFQMFCPSQGWTAISADFRMEVDVNGFSLAGQDLEMDGNHTIRTSWTPYLPVWGSRDNGGVIEPRCLMVGDGENGSRYIQMGRYVPWNLNGTETDSSGNKILLRDNPSIYANPNGKGGRNNFRPVMDPTVASYPFVSRPIYVDGSGTLNFSGGDLEIRIYPDDGFMSDSANTNSQPGDYSQRVRIDMESCSIPAPRLVEGKLGEMRGPRGDRRPRPNTEVQPGSRWTFHREGAFGKPEEGGRLKRFIAWEGRPFIQGGNHDVTRSYVIPHGDTRLAHAQRELESSTAIPPTGSQTGHDKIFVKHPDYDNSSEFIASNFTYGNQPSGYGRDGKPRKRLIALADWGNNDNRSPHLSDHFDHSLYNFWGDFDNTMALELDGPFINKPDEGNSRGIAVTDFNPDRNYGAVDRRFIPYFNQPWTQEAAGPSYWSPNRIMPGPGMFGSLPTGVKNNRPWQTLLFRPLPQDGAGIGQDRSMKSEIHPGHQDPKDHYFLDFFWMPVVEPWSISESLSTAGKVNMNYQIVPFTYIERSTAVRGVMSSEEMLTVPYENARDYTSGWGWGRGYDRYLHTGGSLNQISLRSWINAEETLKQFEAKFDSGELFRAASEICELWLVPEPVKGLRMKPALSDMERMWDPRSSFSLCLTGDNSRERPYTNLVPRLTTKSNTFQVFYRAQVIRQSPFSPANPSDRRTDAEYGTFDPSMDEWVSEYRGATIVERYIDPEDPRIPDYATNFGTTQALDAYYRFRVLSQKRFAP